MTRPVTIVGIRNRHGEGTPAYLFHGAGGNVLNLAMLTRAWPDERPLFGVQAAGLDGSTPPDPSITAMADRYTADLLASGRGGPWLFAGYSGGGIVALEVAHRLQERGERVGTVVLIDTPHPDVDRVGRLGQVRNVVRNAPLLGRDDVRRMATGVWRRVGDRQGTDEDAVEDTSHLAELGFVDLKPHFFAITDAVPRRRYDLDVLVVRAEVFFTRRPQDLGWAPYVTRRLRVRTAPGNHVSMLAKGNAAVLAQRIAVAFDEWEIYSSAPRASR